MSLSASLQRLRHRATPSFASEPIYSENKCATRLLKMDGETVGISVFAQRGLNEWDNWGWSSVESVTLKGGKHTLTLEFADCVENMNMVENKALLKQLRIVKIR